MSYGQQLKNEMQHDGIKKNRSNTLMTTSSDAHQETFTYKQEISKFIRRFHRQI